MRLPERSPFSDVRNADEPHVDDMCGPNEIVRLRPADRAVGARIAHDDRRRRATTARRSRRRRARYTGSAGQSFGAFITDGLTLELDGEANDYVGKSMEGGTIIVRTPGARRRTVDRQRVLLRRARRRGVHHAARPASGSPCATAARGSSSKAPARTRAST